MKTLFIVVLSCLVLVGCEEVLDPCSLVLPGPNYFEINIVDESGNSLIGSTFVQDSFRLFNDTYDKYIQPTPFGSPEYLQIAYDEIESGVEYLIALDSSDIDTLMFKYTVVFQECFTDYTMNTIEYNGEYMTIGNGSLTFDLVKD